MRRDRVEQAFRNIEAPEVLQGRCARTGGCAEREAGGRCGARPSSRAGRLVATHVTDDEVPGVQCIASPPLTAMAPSAPSDGSVDHAPFARSVATPRERLAAVALHELPDESDEAAVRAWVPSAAFRAAVRTRGHRRVAARHGGLGQPHLSFRQRELAAVLAPTCPRGLEPGHGYSAPAAPAPGAPAVAGSRPAARPVPSVSTPSATRRALPFAGGRIAARRFVEDLRSVRSCRSSYSQRRRSVPPRS